MPLAICDFPCLLLFSQVLEYLNAQHRLNLFQTGEILQLQVGQIDQERLKLADPVLAIDTKIVPLRLENAVLSRSKFVNFTSVRELCKEYQMPFVGYHRGLPRRFPEKARCQ